MHFTIIIFLGSYYKGNGSKILNVLNGRFEWKTLPKAIISPFNYFTLFTVYCIILRIITIKSRIIR